jgi:hypothetical protein
MKAIARALATASLLLSAAVQAGDATSSRELPVSVEEGGSCPVDPGVPADRAEMMARLAAKLREAQEAQGPGDVVVLNGRGYRYEGDRVPAIARELQILEVELQRARAAQQREGRSESAPQP